MENEQSLTEYFIKHARDFRTTVLVSGITGFACGGIIGAKWAGDKFIKMHHHDKFLHAVQARRERHTAFMLGFMGQGSKWAMRLGLFSAVWDGTSTVMSYYYPDNCFSNTMLCGALSGAMYRVSGGLKPAIGGLVLGTLCSIPAAMILKCASLILQAAAKD